jgi:hypothetical protein
MLLFLTITGRSLSSCKSDFEHYRTSGSSSALQYTSYASANLAQKRPHGAIESLPQSISAMDSISHIAAGRQLAPKPLAPVPTGATRFQATNVHQHSPLTKMVPHNADTHRKKRGRPSKKEQEERRKLAAGESSSGLLPSPLLGIAPQQAVSAGGEPLGSPGATSMQPNYGAVYTPQRHTQDSSTSGSSGSKKRGRPRKTPTMSLSSINPEPTEYGTPPQTAVTDPRESATDASQLAGSVPPEPGPGLPEPEESRPPKTSDWQNTILQRPPQQ